MKKETKFPFRKCITASIIILLVSFMVLALLYSISVQADIPEYTWIFILVWAILTVGSLIVYWVLQSVSYTREKNDERK